jgi:hypothetical protein
MKILLLAFFLAGLPARADDSPPSVHLYTDFQQPPPRAVRVFLQDEVARIMAPIGLVFQWSSMSENRGNELSVKVAVIRFTGACDTTPTATQPVHSTALGWTYMDEGTVLPFSTIGCDEIRAFLRSDLVARPKEEREESLGRAIGRVVAHELYHIFVNTTRHGSHGVAKSYYSPQELLSKQFQFEQKESIELRRSWSDVATGGM